MMLTAGPEPRFVLHEHFAKHHHFDLRLEHNGVLASWAVPKGLPGKSGERRLAIAVDDHQMEYLGFEGIIPEGGYGAGEVKVSDTGTLTRSCGRMTGLRSSSTAGTLPENTTSSVSGKAGRMRGSS
jgi:DNA ligase D-like protein (predicted 3'-phosphoesterase)